MTHESITPCTAAREYHQCENQFEYRLLVGTLVDVTGKMDQREILVHSVPTHIVSKFPIYIYKRRVYLYAWARGEHAS